MIPPLPPEGSERTILVDPDQLLAVLEATRRLEPRARPSIARRLLILAMTYLHPATGQVMLTRDQAAALLHVSTIDVSQALGTLEKLGVIRREHHASPGRGRSAPRMKIHMNPALAWSGSAEARARWRASPAAHDKRQRRDAE